MNLGEKGREGGGGVGGRESKKRKKEMGMECREWIRDCRGSILKGMFYFCAWKMKENRCIIMLYILRKLTVYSNFGR